MPKRDEAIERVADNVVLSDNRDEIEGHLRYLWNEAIQQTLGTAVHEIVDKSVKELLVTDWGKLYLNWLDENYGKGEL